MVLPYGIVHSNNDLTILLYGIIYTINCITFFYCVGRNSVPFSRKRRLLGWEVRYI
jgi:hypothetical protein